MKAGNKEVEISHPEKILFPESGITKKQIAEYYTKVAPYMMPHLEGRPVSMVRYPNGIANKGFFQKEAQDYFPDYIKQIRVKLKNGESKCYVRIDSAATLAYLANLGNIPIHTWLSRKGSLSKPDMLMWDLDPSDSDFDKVKEGAFLLRQKLEEELGLHTFLKTTGSRGLHIVVPILPEATFTKTREFTKRIADEMAAAHPELFTTEIRKAARGNKIFVDYLRNGFAQTAVAPYSIREKEGAPVAMPITWEELTSKDMQPQKYNIANAMRRLGAKGDVWADMYKEPVSIKVRL